MSIVVEFQNRLVLSWVKAPVDPAIGIDPEVKDEPLESRSVVYTGLEDVPMALSLSSIHSTL
jgi:hypothetical protein